MPSGVYALMLLTLIASRAFLVALWQLHSLTLSAISAFIVASLQLAHAEFDSAIPTVA